MDNRVLMGLQDELKKNPYKLIELVKSGVIEITDDAGNVIPPEKVIPIIEQRIKKNFPQIKQPKTKPIKPQKTEPFLETPEITSQDIKEQRESKFLKYQPIPSTDIAPAGIQPPRPKETIPYGLRSLSKFPVKEDKTAEILGEDFMEIGNAFATGLIVQASAGAWTPKESDTEILKAVNERPISYYLGSLVGLILELGVIGKMALATKLPTLVAKVSPKLGLVTYRSMQWGLKEVIETGIQKIKKGEPITGQDAINIIKETGVGALFGASELPVHTIGSFIATGLVGGSVPLIDKLAKGEKLTKMDAVASALNAIAFMVLHVFSFPSLKRTQKLHTAQTLVKEVEQHLIDLGVPPFEAYKGANTLIYRYASKFKAEKDISKIFSLSNLERTKKDLMMFVDKELRDFVGTIVRPSELGKKTEIKYVVPYIENMTNEQIQSLNKLTQKRIFRIKKAELQIKGLKNVCPIEPMIKKFTKPMLDPPEIEMIKMQRKQLVKELEVKMGKEGIKSLNGKGVSAKLVNEISVRFFGHPLKDLSLEEVKALQDIIKSSVFAEEMIPPHFRDVALTLLPEKVGTQMEYFYRFLPFTQVAKEYEKSYKAYTILKDLYDASEKVKNAMMTLNRLLDRFYKKYKIKTPEQKMKIAVYLDGLIKAEELTPNEFACAKKIRKIYDHYAIHFGIYGTDKYISNYFTHVFKNHDYDWDLIQQIRKRVPTRIKNYHLYQRLVKEGYEDKIMWDLDRVLNIYVGRAERTLKIEPLLKKYGELVNRMPIALKNEFLIRFDTALGKPLVDNVIFRRTIKGILKKVGIDVSDITIDEMTDLMIAMIYSGGLGLKVSSAVKNALQFFHNWAAIGPYWTTQGVFAVWKSPEMRALLKKKGIFGMSYLPTGPKFRFRRKAQRAFHETMIMFASVDRYINRAPVYAGAYMQFKSHYYSHGIEGVMKLLKDVHPGTRTAVLRALKEGKVEKATDFYAWDRMGFGQYIYHFATSPTFTRYKFLKIGAPFLTWPSWYWGQMIPDLIKYNPKGFLMHLATSLMLYYFLEKKLGLQVSRNLLVGTLPSSLVGPVFEIRDATLKVIKGKWENNDRMLKSGLNELKYKTKLLVPCLMGIEEILTFVDELNNAYVYYDRDRRLRDWDTKALITGRYIKQKKKRAILNLLGTPSIKKDLEEVKKAYRKGQIWKANQMLRELERKWGIILTRDEIDALIHERERKLLQMQKEVEQKRKL